LFFVYELNLSAKLHKKYEICMTNYEEISIFAAQKGKKFRFNHLKISKK